MLFFFVLFCFPWNQYDWEKAAAENGRISKPCRPWMIVVVLPPMNWGKAHRGSSFIIHYWGSKLALADNEHITPECFLSVIESGGKGVDRVNAHCTFLPLGMAQLPTSL